MLLTIEQAKSLLGNGKPYAVAGDEALLKALPKGNWIGGTSPYFIETSGGVTTREFLSVQELEAPIAGLSFASYDEKSIKNIARDAPENGFTILIIPASSKTHLEYAQKAPSYEGLFMKPIIGWISGFHLSDLGKASAKTFLGPEARASDSAAVAMHVTLKEGHRAEIGIVNLFKQGAGDDLTFPDDGFSVRDCFVNGIKRNLAEYVASGKLDTKLPLVANYSGAMINVSFQAVDEKAGKVDFYAPVFRNVAYRLAAPVPDYVKEFEKRVPSGQAGAAFSCNCILNFLYSELEGKKTGKLTGPVTFGEIAYQLLNQTLCYLEIKQA
jgi:hypothetical protein